MLERITALPRQVLIAIGAVLLVLVVGVGFMLTRSGPGDVVVGQTSNTAQITDWTNRLAAAKPPITSTTKILDNGSFELKVANADKTNAISAMRIAAKPSVDTSATCTKPSAFDTSGATAYQSCKDQAALHDMLVDRPDIVAADVRLTEYTDDSLDSDTDMKSQAVVTITPAPGATLDGRDLADTIGQSVQGLDSSEVVIWTITGNNTSKIWPQDQSAAGGTCESAETNDIYIRQAAIQSCMQHEIQTQITGLFPSMKPQVTALVSLSPTASSQSVHKLLDGVKTQESTNKAPQSSADQSSTEPSTQDTNSQSIAGYIERQNVSVLLPNATASQLAAVKSLLSGYDNPTTNDVLTVGTTKVATQAPAKSTTVVKQSAATNMPKATSSSMTHWLLIGALLVVAALISAVFWMWQKQQTLTRERAEYEQAFARERASFATTDSDALARQLEAFMGAAPADATVNQG